MILLGDEPDARQGPPRLSSSSSRGRNDQRAAALNSTRDPKPVRFIISFPDIVGSL